MIKDRNNALIKPSQDVVEICQEAERTFRSILGSLRMRIYCFFTPISFVRVSNRVKDTKYFDNVHNRN